MTDHGWPPLQSDLEVSDVLRAVEDEKERAHYEEEEDMEPMPFCETPWGFHAVSPDGVCHTCGKTFPPDAEEEEDGDDGDDDD